MSEQTQADNKNANDLDVNKDTPELKKHTFEAEVAQLLHLVTHSLYSNADIFVRELVSNASDACDKLRFEATNDDSLYEDDGELKIRIDIDEEAKTITFTDNGIGMNEADAIENLGTIAKSGTKAFLDKLSESQKQDGQLIGQFGVGFYSGFIVADTISVESRKATAGARPRSSISPPRNILRSPASQQPWTLRPPPRSLARALSS